MSLSWLFLSRSSPSSFCSRLHPLDCPVPYRQISLFCRAPEQCGETFGCPARAPISAYLLLVILKCFLVANNSLPLLPPSVCRSIHLDGDDHVAHRHSAFGMCGSSSFAFLLEHLAWICARERTRDPSRAAQHT